VIIWFGSKLAFNLKILSKFGLTAHIQQEKHAFELREFKNFKLQTLVGDGGGVLPYLQMSKQINI
jgi:hypothetical protein